MMVTDSERRKVAQDMRDGVKSKTECELLSLNGSSAAIRWLISYVAFGDKKYHSGVDLMNRLADLIEPSCSRTEILELADCFDETARDIDKNVWDAMESGLAWGYRECAKSIREVFGGDLR